MVFLVIMALRRLKKTVLLPVTTSLLLITVVLCWSLGTHSTTLTTKCPAKSVLLPEDQIKNELQHTHNPVQGQTSIETQHNPIEAMYRRLVALTAFSSNHYGEALDMIGSVQKYLPRTKIIVYDIGLTAEERKNVSTFCNVELISFNFTIYSLHVKRKIRGLAWKPLILQELVDEEYDVILYGDASLRVTAHNVTTALQCLLDCLPVS